MAVFRACYCTRIDVMTATEEKQTVDNIRHIDSGLAAAAGTVSPAGSLSGALPKFVRGGGENGGGFGIAGHVDVRSTISAISSGAKVNEAKRAVICDCAEVGHVFALALSFRETSVRVASHL